MATATRQKNTPKTDIDQLSINTIRTLTLDAVQKAESGHPGLPLGMAPTAYVLWTKFLRHNPKNPKWFNRDRFLLSAGHGSMLIYALLHLSGYDLPMEELKRFRQLHSKTPGHPENILTPGVEITTGPLGQGFANGVGMGIAQAHLAAIFNRRGYPVVDNYIYCIVSDGDLMEGVSSEAASLAGHLGLGNLIYLYDDNHISIEGSTDLAFTENRAKRFEAYGWFVQTIEDGNDLEGIDTALKAAEAQIERPSIIMVRTHIAYGSPNKHDTAGAHGSPLGEEEVKLSKEYLGIPLEPKFYIPDDVLTHFRKAIGRGEKAETEWQERLNAYRKAFPELAAEWDHYVGGEQSESWKSKLPNFKPSDGPIATRQASGAVLNAIADDVPMLIGGSADLSPSTDTLIKKFGYFKKGDYGARNFTFGVREHAM